MRVEQQVSKFNKAIEIGETVEVKNDFGEISYQQTQTKARVMCGSGVVKLSESGVYDVSRVTQIEGSKK
jgi:hypothetical protein